MSLSSLHWSVGLAANGLCGTRLHVPLNGCVSRCPIVPWAFQGGRDRSEIHWSATRPVIRIPRWRVMDRSEQSRLRNHVQIPRDFIRLVRKLWWRVGHQFNEPLRQRGEIMAGHGMLEPIHVQKASGRILGPLVHMQLEQAVLQHGVDAFVILASHGGPDDDASKTLVLHGAVVLILPARFQTRCHSALGVHRFGLVVPLAVCVDFVGSLCRRLAALLCWRRVRKTRLGFTVCACLRHLEERVALGIRRCGMSSLAASISGHLTFQSRCLARSGARGCLNGRFTCLCDQRQRDAIHLVLR
mmetsp:Transcript_19658/g.53917  ORF Transcript_19658/g.53917 Transcript_19658/m.53917 type:complete len:300 (-) Transcript_19658:283-1182(-)